MNSIKVAKNYEQIHLNNSESWIMTWYPPNHIPDGKPHGSVGICLPENDKIVLISVDSINWDLPAGRPKQNETYEQTLIREMDEEACLTIQKSNLLGYCKVNALVVLKKI